MLVSLACPLINCSNITVARSLQDGPACVICQLDTRQSCSTDRCESSAGTVCLGQSHHGKQGDRQHEVGTQAVNE